MTKQRTKAGTSKVSATERQRQWVEAMIQNGGNQTQAAVAIGIKPGSAAEKFGYRMSKDVRVAAMLGKRRAEVLAEAQEKTQLTADEVIASLARDIRFDPARLYRPDGSLKSIHEMDEDTRLALRGVEVAEITAGEAVVGYTKKVRFPEKTAAREQGMKHFGLYEADNKQVAEALKQVSDAELATELERYTALARNARAGAGAGESAAPRTSAKKLR